MSKVSAVQIAVLLQRPELLGDGEATRVYIYSLQLADGSLTCPFQLSLNPKPRSIAIPRSTNSLASEALYAGYLRSFTCRCDSPEEGDCRFTFAAPRGISGE